MTDQPAVETMTQKVMLVEQIVKPVDLTRTHQAHRQGPCVLDGVSSRCRAHPRKPSSAGFTTYFELLHGAPRPSMNSAWSIASCLIRMDSSSGNSTFSRLLICSGLHAVAHHRSWRWGLVRLFYAGVRGSSTIVPPARWTLPASRSCT